MYLFIYLCLELLDAQSAANRTGSPPQGFYSLVSRSVGVTVLDYCSPGQGRSEGSNPQGILCPDDYVPNR